MLDGVGVLEDVVDGEDVLLLSTGLSNGVREAFLSIVRGQPDDGSDARPHALYGHRTGLDERSVPVAWPAPLEGLKQAIEEQAIEAALMPATSSKASSLREP